MRHVADPERRARLARRHLLLPETRTDDVAAIAEAVVALHSSDPVSVYLSALVRMATPDLGAVEAALYDRRSVLRHHAMRRTLWVATPATTRALHAAATVKIAAAEHTRTAAMLANNGISDAAGWLTAAKRDALAVLHEHGPMTTRDLGHRVPELARPLVLAPGKSYEATVAAHTRVLLVLGFSGELVRTRPVGSWISGQYTWAVMDSWLPGGVTGMPERDACRVLALAWLHRFGPGSTADLAWWTGWTLTVTRRAIADVEAVEVSTAAGPAWLAPDDLDEVDAGPWVALLPGLDPTVMGWKERAWYLPDAASDSFDRNGNGGPTVWVDGRVVGAWAQRPDGELRVHYFLDVPARRRAQVTARASEVSAWVGETRFSVRFPGLIQRALWS